jgi:hypothetical protein
VAITAMEPRAAVPFPIRLRWWGWDEEATDMPSNGFAYAILYTRFRWGGDWVWEADSNWEATVALTVQAWCEGSAGASVQLRLSGLQGPYPHPVVEEAGP